MKGLTAKNMKRTLLENPEKLSDNYDVFEKMNELGYIDKKEWKAFDNECKYWEYNIRIDAVQETQNGKIIKAY